MSAADAARLARIARLRARLAETQGRLLAQRTAALAEIEALETQLAAMRAQTPGPADSGGADAPGWTLGNAHAAWLRLERAAASLAARRTQAQRQWTDAQSATLLARGEARAAGALARARARAAEEAEFRRATEDAPALARALQRRGQMRRPPPRREH